MIVSLRRPDDQRLFELRGGIGNQPAVRRWHQAVVRDDGALLGEPFDVLGLLLEERLAG